MTFINVILWHIRNSKMPFTKVSEQEKCFIIAKFEEGRSIRAVARLFITIRAQF
jgi:hypothetical protein